MANESKTFLQKMMELQKAMADMIWEKDGKNMQQSYKYITEAQYKNNFSNALIKAGLLWECECVDYEFIEHITEKMHMIIARFEGKLTDPESGENHTYRLVGTGCDNGDKALYKAYTGALKYFLANQYLAAEGDEPEKDQLSIQDRSPKAPIEKPAETKKPVTEEARHEIKSNLTNADGGATKTQFESLKRALKKLREADPSQEPFIAEVASKTTGFTGGLTKADCDKLMDVIKQRIDEASAVQAVVEE